MPSVKRILNVTVKRIVDGDGDTSWLGEFSDDAASEFSIVHVGEYAGEFISDVPCNCSHKESEHDEDGECLQCRGNDDECSDFDRDLPERGREYRYFNPSLNYVDANGDALPENTPDEVRKYVKEDYQRMVDLSNGAWCFVGIRADAQVKLNGDLVQDITSGGLWGIESDAGDYFKEVEGEQLSELRGQLYAMGFSNRAIATALRDVEHKDE